MIATNLPAIPDNAPFTPDQRAWLNGFLAGLFSNAPQQTQAAQIKPLHFGVYFATQSGTAERLAKKMAKELKAKGHTAEVSSLEKITVAKLAAEENAVFFASTYGEGDPPDDARSFRNALLSESTPALTSLRYAMFALGDKHYEHFCKFGIEIDERLQQLGATPILPRIESDVEVDEPFSQWTQDLTARLADAPADASARPLAAAVAPTSAAPELVHGRDNPFHAELRQRVRLTSEVSSKVTMHLSFGLEDSAIHYSAGDACGVIAQNDPALVAEILSLMPFPPSAQVTLAKFGIVTIEDALLHHLQPTRLTRKIVQAFAEKATCSKLSALLPPDQESHLEAYLYDRDLVDLLIDCPGVITSPDDLVALLPRLAPRLYSISSSPAAHGREVHCTVAVVRYRSHNRERAGVASTMLADRVSVGSRLPIYIQPNKRFRLPADGDAPMIMIGPGTGIAPFRSFLHERQALGQKGRNWLFFGERSSESDFLYRPELQSMRDDGHLTRLDTAFSRDQANKVYVQDRMREHGAEIWRWLNEGAQLFVCGDASRMAKDVDATLHSVVEKHGGMGAENAREYVSQLHEDRRYHRDVY